MKFESKTDWKYEYNKCTENVWLALPFICPTYNDFVTLEHEAISIKCFKIIDKALEIVCAKQLEDGRANNRAGTLLFPCHWKDK